MSAAIYAAEAYAISKITSALAPKPPSGAGRNLGVAIVDTGADGFAIFGTVRVSGVNNIPSICGGPNGRYQEQGLAIAIHEVDSFSDVTFDDVVIADADIGTVTGTTNDGAVGGGTKFSGKAWIRRYRGTSTDSADAILTNRYPSVFTGAFRGRGNAKMILTYDWADGKTYQGIPNAVVLTNGARVYDPRLDSTNGGSGAHRVADPTTWEFTHGGVTIGANPALCLTTFMMAAYGGRVASAGIDWPSVAAAATVCDTLVNIPGSATQCRYTFNTRLDVAQDWRINAQYFVDAMLGRLIRRGAKWYIYAGAWSASSFTVNKLDWMSIDSIVTVQPRDGGHWNDVHVWYVDPTRNWQRVECFPRTSATYKTADGNEKISLPIEQPHCTNEYEAQRKGEFTLRRSRNQIVLAGVLPPRFRFVAVGDVGTFNFPEIGWSGKTLRVANIELGPDSSLKVGLAEEQSTDWTDLDPSEYNSPSISTLPGVSVPTTPSAPNNFSAIAINGTLSFGWAAPDVVPKGTQYRIWYAPTSLSDPGSKTLLWEGSDTGKSVPFTTNSPFYYQIQAFANSYVSDYTPNTFGIPLTAGLPGNTGAWGVTLSPSGIYQSAALAAFVSPTVSAVVNGGSSPAYAWSEIGSSGITIVASNQRQTTFSVVSMTPGQERVGTFKCTVTDGVNSAAPQLTVDCIRSSGGGGGKLP